MFLLICSFWNFYFLSKKNPSGTRGFCVRVSGSFGFYEFLKNRVSGGSGSTKTRPDVSGTRTRSSPTIYFSRRLYLPCAYFESLKCISSIFLAVIFWMIYYSWLRSIKRFVLKVLAKPKCANFSHRNFRRQIEFTRKRVILYVCMFFYSAHFWKN